MTLYEIERGIEAAIEAVLNSVNEETGEVDQEAAEALAQLQAAREEKLDNIGCYMKNLKAEADAIKAEVDALNERLSAKKKKYERLKDYVTNNLMAENNLSFESARVRFSFRKSVSVNIISEDDLPKKYKKIKEEPDKTAIKQALNEGKKVRGAELVEKQNLQIK